MTQQQNKVVSGARAKVYITRAGETTPKLYGFFNNISYQVAYDVQPVFTLGRYSAADVNYTAMELVSVRASGFRVYDNDPNTIAPTVNELLAQTSGMELQIFDRQNTGAPLAKVTGLLCTGYDTGVTARGMTEVSFSFVGRTVEQEGIGQKAVEETTGGVPSQATNLDNGTPKG